MLAVACESAGNTGQWAPDASLVQAVPWLNGTVPTVDAGRAVIPVVPEYPPIATGLPDPGSKPADCSVLAGIEPSQAWVETFEPDIGGGVGVASAWAGFDDLTKYSFHLPGDITWYTGLAGMYGAPWGLPAYPAGGPSCDGKPNNWSLHFEGGLFRNWGGGVSHVFTDPNGCPQRADFCNAPPPQPDGGWANGPDSHDTVDASSYEGIAFWARRGPESQDRLLVTVTDNFTSEHLARQSQTYCRRAKPCHTQCLSGTPCSLDSATDPMNPIYRCFDPQAGPLPNIASGNAPIPAQLDLMYPRCGRDACTSPGTYRDPDFDGKKCRPHTFPAAEWFISGEFCFNDNDLPPPDRDERCIDGWVKTVQLTTDWQYYTVPFAEMQQGGFGKRAPYFNLKAIDTVALGFIVGWADVYVDNVSFYRRKKP